MRKPNNYDNVQAFGTYTPLEVGGHICVIKKIEEVISKTGKDMIKIYIDTDKTDKQPNYYMDQYKNNTRDNKKWSASATINQLVYAANGETSPGFKTFIEAVKNSNAGLTDDKIFGDFPLETNLKNKLVGGVFGKEEYLTQTGESRFSVKCQGFRNVEDVRKGLVEPPKDKLLNPNGSSSTTGFEDVMPIDDGDMPF